MPSVNGAKASRSAICTPTKCHVGSANPRGTKAVTAPSEVTTTPPYRSGAGLGITAIVTSASDAECSAAIAVRSTSVSVSPLTSHSRSSGTSEKALRGPPPEPSNGTSQE